MPSNKHRKYLFICLIMPSNEHYKHPAVRFRSYRALMAVRGLVCRVVNVFPTQYAMKKDRRSHERPLFHDLGVDSETKAKIL